MRFLWWLWNLLVGIESKLCRRRLRVTTLGKWYQFKANRENLPSFKCLHSAPANFDRLRGDWGEERVAQDGHLFHSLEYSIHGRSGRKGRITLNTNPASQQQKWKIVGTKGKCRVIGKLVTLSGCFMGNIWRRLMEIFPDVFLDNICRWLMENICGRLMGNISGCFMGNICRCLMGNISGWFMGNISGWLMGNVCRCLMDNVFRIFMRNICGRLMGNICGCLMENIFGCFIYGKYLRLVDGTATATYPAIRGWGIGQVSEGGG